MKLKNSFKVGADMWGILREPVGKRGDAWGVTTYKDLTVTIDSEAPDSKVREALLHELLHVVDFQGTQEHALKEDEIKRLSVWLITVFHDNPWLKGVLFG